MRKWTFQSFCLILPTPTANPTTDMIEIRDHFREIAHLLRAKADVAGGIGHLSTTGSLREPIIQDFLGPHLPRTAESVIAPVEVKSYLDKGQLLDSLSKAVRIKALKRKGSQEYRKGPALIISPDPIPILAYIG